MGKKLDKMISLNSDSEAGKFLGAAVRKMKSITGFSDDKLHLGIFTQVLYVYNLL
jgi:hypothetical protein